MVSDIPVIRATVPCIRPPAWAILERRLLEAWAVVPDVVATRYLRHGGEMLWPPSPNHRGIDGLDDAYESFQSWPLAYLLGADDRFLTAAERQFDVITEQFSRYDTGFGRSMVVDEYEQGYDWFHQGEGYLLFYYLCQANPACRANVQRARRFAGIWMNERPAPNGEAVYDPGRRLIRAPYAGSFGAGFDTFGHAWPESLADWMGSGWGMPLQGVAGVDTADDLRDPQKANRYVEVMRERIGRGDTVMNLAATSMATNAYLATGDEACRRWAIEYLDAWIDRWQANDGIVPDNVGLSGHIGEHLGGKWYGGWYGWTFPGGFHSVGAALAIGAENGVLLTGDRSYLELLRSQLQLLADLGIDHEDRLLIPFKHGDPGWYGHNSGPKVLRDEQGDVLFRDGWFEFQPAEPEYPTHLWAISQQHQDLELARLLLGDKTANGDAELFSRPGPNKDLGGHDNAWLAYLQGTHPDYPERILEYSLAVTYAQLQAIDDDKQDPSSYGDAYLQQRNSIASEALVQLTMGAPQPVYYGGLLHARFRYFDGDRRRPGLPADVAALVSSLDETEATLTLVNLSTTEPHTVIIQGGAFGEHQLDGVRCTTRPDGHRLGLSPLLETPPVETSTTMVGGPRAAVAMAPHSQITLTIEMRRFHCTPSYATPWSS